ncbi:inositol monophosphatase family protein [soil metagenome]
MMQEELKTAVEAAHAAGRLLIENCGAEMQVDEFADHDIKLELDVRSQDLITGILLGRFPHHALYGEEGIVGDQASEWQWVVDPIDGTVNYFFGIPHFCVSIGLRRHGEIVLGVILDPSRDELWTVVRGGVPELNGRPIAVSRRSELRQSVMTVGFSKTKQSMAVGFERFQALAYEVRKTRMLGSAALAMAYIACGRLDAYIEEEISLWDIAAGWLLVEAAGGTVVMKQSESAADKFFICASNGKLPLEPFQ